MTLHLGDTVQLPSNQQARLIALTDLFGQTYADVFVLPGGPVQRLLAAHLHPVADPLAALRGAGTLTPAPRFIAQVAAHQLRALLTQQGVLSAANFRVTPLPHQILAVDFVLGLPRMRALIADEVGLGKTIEAALIYEELKLRRMARRVLVVAPGGLTHQWRDELEQKFGEQFAVYDRALLGALRALHGQETNLWTLHPQVITSLDFVKPQRLRDGLSPQEQTRRESANRRMFADMVAAGWDVVIFDEAHKLSKHADGSETARYRVGDALSQAAPVCLMLTATPHQGDPARFMHLLTLLDPYSFGDVADLRPERVNTVVWRTRKRAAVDAQGHRLFKQRITDVYPVERSGPEHALERELYDAVTEYVRENYNRALGRGDRAFGFLMILFQRMVTSSTQAIYAALQKRLEKLRALEPHPPAPSSKSGEGKEADRPGEGEEFDEEAAAEADAETLIADLGDTPGVVNATELASELDSVTALLDLARRACLHHDAKMVALLDIIDEVCRRERAPDTKALIFTEFVATQDALKTLLEGMGYRVAVIHGGQSLAARTAARQDFAGDAQFLVSTDAGGEGINLQFCHVQINYDLPWNPMKLEQRIGRLDRIGQTHDVLVLNLLMADTVEQRVREVLETKLALIRRQYGEDKLADILSTLQDEFHFDRLYMDALQQREAESAALEAVAQQIYTRAQQILEQDELLLPQAQAEVARARERVVEVSQTRVRALLTGYLAQHGLALSEYARRPGVYYFDLPDSFPLSQGEGPGVRGHYADVVFDRERAVNDDGLTYLHLNHPVVQHILAELGDGYSPAAAHLRVRGRALPEGATSRDGPYLWALYRLQMTDHHTLNRQDLIAICVDAQGHSHPRLATALLDLPPEDVETAFIPLNDADLAALHAQAGRLAEAQAHDRFNEAQLAHAERLAAEREKLERYYGQQERAVAQIAIENIRQAKHREVLERRRADLAALEQRATLTPDLTLLGLAWLVVQ